MLKLTLEKDMVRVIVTNGYVTIRIESDDEDIALISEIEMISPDAETLHELLTIVVNTTLRELGEI